MTGTYGWARSAAALTMAEEQLRKDKIIDDSIQFRYISKSAVSAATSVGGAVELVAEGADLLIGPAYSKNTKPALYYSSNLNHPHWSWSSTHSDLTDKTVFITLVRTLGSYSRFGAALEVLFNEMHWRKMAYFIYDRVIVLCAGTGSSVVKYERRIMLAARRKGMTSGDFVFLVPGSINAVRTPTPWYKANSTENEEAWQAYQVVMDISWASAEQKTEQEFRRILPYKMTEFPWFFNHSLERYLRQDPNSDGAPYSVYLYDLMYLYGLVLRKAWNTSVDIRNGSALFELAKGVEFRGASGDVRINDNGDRDPDYWIWDYREINGVKERIVAIKINAKDGVSIIRRKLKDELQRMLWKIDFTEIRLSFQRRGLGSQVDYDSILSLARESVPSQGQISTEKMNSQHPHQIFTQVGQYRGQLVAVKRIHRTAPITLTIADHLELKAMRESTHENVNQFIGACLDPPNYCLLYSYSAKGSLVDVLENEDIKLDITFKTSMIHDIINGLGYIHGNYLRQHGRLKSSNCVIDNRWVLKITDFGLNRLKQDNKRNVSISDQETGEHKIYRDLWWTAPELLRAATDVSLTGTQKGDIYSIGIIIYEIMIRSSPYNTGEMAPKDIIERVQAGGTPSFRPTIAATDNLNSCWVELITECWAENPELRPDTNSLKRSLKSINKGKGINIMDHMVSMLEKYANNLEDIVEQRTLELIDEKRKTDALLFRMLPKSVAEKLKQGHTLYPESFDSVTIYFSDIVGFTRISATSTPMQVIDLLNDLYTMFDSNIERYDVYKVETIGDAYMVVSGLPHRNGNRHVAEIADMALSLLSSVLTFTMRHMPQVQLQIRIGLHTGSCCAGVVGLAMPRYCLFGDTVNTASRMESNGQGLRIHISNECFECLQIFEGYQTECRGIIDVKGKGKQNTFWLNGKDGFDKRLPSAADLEPQHTSDGFPMRAEYRREFTEPEKEDNLAPRSQISKK
ncbi:atrial natriuretic peptide receptor 1-like [Tubulanus polymorphus]|uniref:atrial natriuretic peptide receptor 1-like n=1 Tax=Tubulanus polymorphus TaxID=672921 RepID=UPI003DA488F0